MGYYGLKSWKRQKMANNIEIEQEKERLTNILSTQYSQSLIAIDEYERLLDFVNKTETNKEIEYLKKIIDVNETYTLKNNNVVQTINNLPVTVKKSFFWKFNIFKKDESNKKIVNYNGIYELKLYVSDFIENKLSIKITLYNGEIHIYIPKNTLIVNNIKRFNGNIRFNEQTEINSNDFSNELTLKGTMYNGNIFLIYNK
jgi:hypothetical protein